MPATKKPVRRKTAVSSRTPARKRTSARTPARKSTAAARTRTAARKSAAAARKRHEVRMKLPAGGFEIGRSDIRFDVLDSKDGKIGTLLVSRGALEWKSFNSPKRRKYSWDRFDQLMTDAPSR